MPDPLPPDSTSTDRNIEYSIILPIYNEEESLEFLFAEILQALTPMRCSYEIIFINDGSTDRSLPILEEFWQRLPEIVKIISLPHKEGQTNALRTGFESVQGRVAITLDGDLQNDPADIPRLLAKMDQGYDCVCGWRQSREDRLLKAFLSKLGNVLQRVLTGLKIHDISCTLRAYRRECLKDIKLEWEGQHRFIPLTLSRKGYKVGEIVSHHRKRRFGVSKYSHKRIFKVIIDFLKIVTAKGQ